MSFGIRFSHAWARRLATLLLFTPLVFVAAGLGLREPSLTWLTTWGSTLVFMAGAVICAAQARVRRPDGTTWWFFAGACTLWSLANLYYAVIVSPAAIPMPSPADIGYFGFPIMVAAGLLSHLRTRRDHLPVDALLDGLIVGLATAAIAAAIVHHLDATTLNHFGAVLTSLVYPLEDVIVLGMLVGVISLLGWRPGRVALLLAAAVVCIALADGAVFARVLDNEPVGGAWINAGWTAGIALIAFASTLEGRAARPSRRSSQSVEVPLVFFVLALGLLALSGVLVLGIPATLLGVAALGACGVRLWRSFREVESLLESRALALTDELTGLPNRRRLLADLQSVCDRRAPRRLAIFDLDGFKLYNDTYGHIDGDRLLTTLAHRLAMTVQGHGQAYRLGGDEFCALLDAQAGEAAVERAAAALGDEGYGWSVGASFGSVLVPDEASEISAALRIADRRMYERKARRPEAARRQAGDVLLSALGEQQPALRSHTDDVTVLAGAVAGELGMSCDAADDVMRAAELHDVGKLAIPREILEKPGPLDAREWDVMRRHTLIGERMLEAAPALRSIAPLVRSSHERWDGRGYPDGLAGAAIPLGARIVAVCDAFDAMTSDRAYRRARPVPEAIAELRRSAGSQFDPDVVDAFLSALARASAPEHAGVAVNA